MKRLKNEKIVIGTISPSGSFAMSAQSNEGSYGSLPASTSKKTQQAQQLIAEKKKKMLLPIGDIEDEISDEALAKKNQQEKKGMFTLTENLSVM